MLLGHKLTNNEPVEIEPRDLARHLLVVGGTGTGKSSLLVNFVLQHAHDGEGLAFIDPHGDASQAILDRLPAHAPVIYINPSDPTHAVGFNPLDCPDPTQRTVIADNTTSAFKHAFPDSWGPRLESLLLMACRTLLESQGPTLRTKLRAET
jgi:DNA helicase HerA-like ATPase